MVDKTNYVQGLMHMIKGNLGAGMLAMPASFAHAGYLGGSLGLPALCLISVYSVHLLLRSSRYQENRMKGQIVSDYADLAKSSFEVGPRCLRSLSATMGHCVAGLLLVTQLGVGCVYLVFIVDNVTSILATYGVFVSKTFVFFAIFPLVLGLGCIRTLKRLSVASMIANLLQTFGLALVLEYLLRDFNQINLDRRERFMPIKDMALGFGSAMFAFEGISVVLPIYSRLKQPEHMAQPFGLVNLSFVGILILYFVVGLFGYLKFGHHVRDSITLNLPAEPLYDGVRAAFTTSILLSYPLQLYVPNEIIWNYIKNNLLLDPVTASASTMVGAVDGIVPGIKIGLEKRSLDETNSPAQSKEKHETVPKLVRVMEDAVPKPDGQVKLPNSLAKDLPSASENNDLLKHEYCCRALVVCLTFVLAYSVPKLNLLMDLVGSLSGTILSITLPAALHLVTFWRESKGLNKVFMIFIDGALILFSLAIGGMGSVISLATILKSFNIN